MHTPPDLLEAVIFAVRRHAGQTRKATATPYVLHPLRTARTVMAITLPEGVRRDHCAVAAVLHDTLEDTPTTAAELEARFGPQVTRIVEELTQDQQLPKAQRRRRMLDHCGQLSPAARVVKLADRLDNLREMDSLGDAFIQRYCAETTEMLAKLRGACPELEAAVAAELRRHSGPGP